MLAVPSHYAATFFTPCLLLQSYCQTTASNANVSSIQLVHVDWSTLLQLKTATKYQEKFSGQQRWAVPGQKMKVGGVLAGVQFTQICRVR